MGKKRKAKQSCEPTAGSKRPRAEALDVSFHPGSRNSTPSVADVQALLLKLLTGECDRELNWVDIRNAHLLRRIVVVVVPYVDLQTVREHGAEAPFLSQMLCERYKVFPMRHSTPPPVSGCSCCPLISALFSANCVASAKQAKVSATAAGVSRIDNYIATKDELARSGYPLDGVRAEALTKSNEAAEAPEALTSAADNGDDNEGWTQVSSKRRRCKPGLRGPDAGAAGEDSDRGKLRALDCEMVQTTAGLRLARVAIVDAELVVRWDALVRPKEDITDYLTPYSGITEEMMRGVSTSLEDAQRLLLDHIKADTILVGHSLENDLAALRMSHSRIIDTALLYPHAMGWPHRNSLRHLAKQHLKRDLQREAGHDPIADAKAAMELALLKFAKGPLYGDSACRRVSPLGACLRRGSNPAPLSLTDKPNRVDASGSAWHFAHCELRVVSDEAAALQAAREACAVASAAPAAKSAGSAADTFGAEFPAAPVTGSTAQGATPRALDVVVLREFQELCERHAGEEQRPADTIAAGLGALDARLREIASALASDVLLVAMSVSGDNARFLELQRRKAACCSAGGQGGLIEGGWTVALEGELERAKLRRESPFGALLVGGQ